ncbi:MAG: PQQ-binding-like beta-propeller repeat protein [Bryobacteraceae bacterium]
MARAVLSKSDVAIQQGCFHEREFGRARNADRADRRRELKSGEWTLPGGEYCAHQQSPWGTLTAVNANTGDIAWRVPLGSFAELHAKGVPKTGTPNMGGSIATARGLVFIAATVDARFRAFDSRTGRELWVTDLATDAQSTPITFAGKNGKQYVAVMASGSVHYVRPSVPGRLYVYALP